MSTQSGNVFLHNAAVANGNGNVLPMFKYRFATVAISGTFNATITFQATMDNINWFNVGVTEVTGTTRTHKDTTNAPGMFHFDEFSGVNALRAVISGWSSGSVTVVGNATV